MSARHTISATELVRRLGDVLGRVRYLGESFLIERNGRLVARLGPAEPTPSTTMRAALAAWRAAGPPDRSFASDLARMGRKDRPPKQPWASS